MSILDSILSELGLATGKARAHAPTGALGDDAPGAGAAGGARAGRVASGIDEPFPGATAGARARNEAVHPYLRPGQGATSAHGHLEPPDDSRAVLLDAPLDPVPLTLGDAAQVTAAQRDAVPPVVEHDEPVSGVAATPHTPVDVAARLDALAAHHAERLDWRGSIVDLLRLLGLDGSLAAREALADELGCPPAEREDAARMNLWLHRAVFLTLVDNGGRLPAELLS